VNQTVPRALKFLGYTPSQIEEIVAHIHDNGTVTSAPHLKEEHKPVFACAVGSDAIHYLGHVKMMGAVQPFISGAISKTVNMPEDVSVEDVEQLHIDAWKLGLKAVAIYRDNCKVAQPLSSTKKEDKQEPAPAAAVVEAPATIAEAVNDRIVVKGAIRRVLPRRRTARTYKFRIADLKGFFTVGEYEDGTPGEVFVSVSKQGSTLRGLMDAFSISLSHGLQYGVPLKSFAKAMMSTSYAPSGITDDPEIRTASSITDYIARRLALDYLSFDDRLELGLASFDDMPEAQTSLLTDDTSADGLILESEKASEPTVTVKVSEAVVAPIASFSQPAPAANESQKASPAAASALPKVGLDPAAPLCFSCGNQTQRAGSCYVCTSCGSTSGCS
jgi:ribonucleoside-diphosphate reductase alpha chain